MRRVIHLSTIDVVKCKFVFQVYDALKESGMLDNTIIVFTTDNGGAPKGFDSNEGSNYPLRGIKTSLFEG